MNRSHSLGTDKISHLLWKFSLPAIVGMLVNALYNVIDSIFVGNGVGEIGLAAVTISFPLMLILMGLAMLIGVGAASLVSIRLGEQNKDGAEKILGNALTLGIILSLLFSGTVIWFLDPVLTALGATPNVLPYARDFARIILLGSLFGYISFGMNNIVRAEGNPKMAMATQLISALLNTILNPLFIFGLKLGISGSALATVIAQAVSAVWVLSYFFSNKTILKLKRNNLGLDRNVVISIVGIGMSPFLMQVAGSIVSVLYNYSLLQYGGELAVAAIGIITRVGMLIMMPLFGINQGVQPLIGFNYGARQYHRVIEALKLAVAAATVFATAGFAFTQVFDAHIIRLFNSNPDLVAIGSRGLRIFLFMLPIIGFQIVSANYFQAVGKAGYAIFLSMSRQVVLLIPAILVFPHLFGLVGVWYAAPFSDLTSSLLTALFLFREIRKLKEA